jgi:hypothetical protein
MTSESARCQNRVNGKPCGGTCFKVDVSRLEEGMGHEKFRCDKCGQSWKLIRGGKPIKVSR